MYKLHRLGVSVRLLTLIDDCHTNISWSVVLNQTRSSWFLVSQGIRQGGILSTLLYLVFINGLLQEIQILVFRVLLVLTIPLRTISPAWLYLLQPSKIFSPQHSNSL